MAVSRCSNIICSNESVLLGNIEPLSHCRPRQDSVEPLFHRRELGQVQVCTGLVKHETEQCKQTRIQSVTGIRLKLDEYYASCCFLPDCPLSHAMSEVQTDNAVDMAILRSRESRLESGPLVAGSTGCGAPMSDAADSQLKLAMSARVYCPAASHSLSFSRSSSTAG